MKTTLFIVLLIVNNTTFTQNQNDTIFDNNKNTNTKNESSIKDHLKTQNNKLQIGNILYLRLNTNLTDNNSINNHTLSIPNLINIYLDTRPNNQLRTFVQKQMHWNPSISEQNNKSFFEPNKRTSIRLNKL